MKEKVRIIIEFNGDYARDDAKNELSSIQQIVMRRNPLDEPSVFCIVSSDNGRSWNIDNSI